MDFAQEKLDEQEYDCLLRIHNLADQKGAQSRDIEAEKFISERLFALEPRLLDQIKAKGHHTDEILEGKWKQYQVVWTYWSQLKVISRQVRKDQPSTLGQLVDQLQCDAVPRECEVRILSNLYLKFTFDSLRYNSHLDGERSLY